MADSKTTALSAFTPITTDLLYGVDDPGGAPISGKVTFGDVYALGGKSTFAAGTLTTSQPMKLTQTWNDVSVTFGAWVVNVTDTNSATASLLADLQIAGTTKFSVGKDGLALAVKNGGVAVAAFSSGLGFGRDSSSGGLGLYVGYVNDEGGQQCVQIESTTSMHWQSGMVLAWGVSANTHSGVDTGLARNAAGVVEVNSGAAGTLRDLVARSVRGAAVAFASLPTGVEGMLVGVTDSTTAAWGATITGGGGNHVLAYFNGTNWTVAGK